MNRYTPFHLVDSSPWPLLGSLASFSIFSWFLVFFHGGFSMESIVVPIFSILVLWSLWGRDMIRESSMLGFHNSEIQKNLFLGMIFFIGSEVFFFFSFFWTFFYSSLNPSVDVSMMWPPQGVETLNPLGLPLVNTMVLLGSGVAVTWSHYSLMNNVKVSTTLGLVVTIGLGILFTLLQLYEYGDVSFNMTDSAYGSVFFMTTGFHSFHVLVGSLFLIVNLLRLYKGQVSNNQTSYECAIWYWHFVDVVWLFLFIVVYWWGSYVL